MGSSFSVTTAQVARQQEQQFQPLGTLLRNNNDGLPDAALNWDHILHSLRESPEQACLYAHHVEPSPLFLALCSSCPADVAKLLIDEYEDALDHNYQQHTVLDAACQGRGCSGEVIQLLLSQRPLLARIQNPDGLLPLHKCRSVGGAKVLIRAYPEAVIQRSRSSGSLPLHHVLLDIQIGDDGESNTAADSTELCRVLMDASTARLPASGLLTRNKKGQTPLSLLIGLLDKSMSASSNQGLLETTNNLWDLLLSACLPRLMKHHQTVLELHTLIEQACCHSQRLMDRALKYFHKQSSLRDREGRTPLHIAAHIGSCCSTEALESLIRANPKAPRMTDNEGRLPIDWAAESPHTPVKSLSLLVKGEPRAVDTRDLRDRQYPFVSAAISEHTSLNNTYYLLRAKPHVISYFHTP
jgi:Ankyrin repeat